MKLKQLTNFSLSKLINKYKTILKFKQYKYL